jgi:hypothetical protein
VIVTVSGDSGRNQRNFNARRLKAHVFKCAAVQGRMIATLCGYCTHGIDHGAKRAKNGQSVTLFGAKAKHTDLRGFRDLFTFLGRYAVREAAGRHAINMGIPGS